MAGIEMHPHPQPHPGPRQRHNAGQALPLALVLLLAVLASLLWMFNSGQLVEEKLRLSNTADAVAYSAGVFEARLLNYDAYTNRAIVANEIAIAQAVGVASWAKYMGTTADNIGPYLNLIPYIGPILSQVMDYVKSIMDILTPALAATIPVHDAAIQALSWSQFLVHGPGNSLALNSRHQLMEAVAHANDPAIRLDPLPLHDDFAAFTTRWQSIDERQRLGSVVNDSRDSFLRSRNWAFGDVILCTGIALRKRGSTELINLTDGWKSMDTLSAHHYRLRRLRCRHREHALGYGSAFSADELEDRAYSYAGSRHDNPRASAEADSSEGIAEGFDPAPTSIAGGAIPSFHELSRSALRQHEPRSALSIRVFKPAAAQAYSAGDSSIQPGGRLELYQGRHAGGGSAAIARVEVFFARPDRGNSLHPGRREIGSLFNPYWQVRLAPISSSERIAAQLRQSSSQLP